MELPPAYLDYNSMASHQFVERPESPLLYRLIFDKRRFSVLLSLLLPSLIHKQKKDMLLPERRQKSMRGERRQPDSTLQLSR